MAALTSDRDTPRREGIYFSFGVSASVKCFKGAGAVLSAGFIEPATAATGLVTIGRFVEHVEGGAADGDEKAKVEAGIFQYANSASADLIEAADIGNNCYWLDDQTVAKTDGDLGAGAGAARSVAGKIVDVDSKGVWVALGVHK